MKITFVIADTWTSICQKEITGDSMPAKKRIVTIELTKEQKEKLFLNCVGSSGGKDIFEEIFEVFVEN